ncbi:sensor histidine kinase [Cohnella laeviribosi]|uniref:sensor histidine kinase n=1 Tax=Cohnella laeviribosi TaxID=380174 RepID=UPI00036B8785|nr:sensor histidine kinase [Cohnella laeviribosi]
MFTKIKMQTGFTMVFSAVILLIIFMMYWFINQYVLNAYEQVMISNSRQLNIKLSEQVDLYFNDLNQLSKNSVGNQNLMSDMRELDRLTHELTQYENLFFDRSFESYSSYLLNYSELSKSRVYIYGRQNRFKFAYGALPLESNFETIYNDPAYKNRIAGRAVFYYRNANTTDNPDQPSISVIRAFSEISGYVLGYIEIQQDYAILNKIANLGNSGSVYIIDRNGQIVYPAEKIDRDTAKMIREVMNKGGAGIRKGNYFYTSYTSSESGLTTIVKHANEAVFRPLYSLQNTTLFTILAVCAVSILTIYLVTKRMTEPIRKLRSNILKVDFDNFSLFTNRKSPSNEINLLNEAFQQMMERLRYSMERELAASKEEMKARFSALQAQIAPHFIHNILYLISISAEEDRKQDVISMCKSLSDMLRYMAESPSRNVTLAEEMDYTLNYMALIEYKYEDFIEFSIDIQETARAVVLPRLTIQPFVENAIKHAFNDCDPPWKIAVSCKADGHEWEIIIRDNGAGIPPEKLASIQAQIADILTADTVAYNESSGIGGLGIINTVMRLKMLYPQTLRFELDKSEEGGVCIRMRASIHPDP